MAQKTLSPPFPPLPSHGTEFLHHGEPQGFREVDIIQGVPPHVQPHNALDGLRCLLTEGEQWAALDVQPLDALEAGEDCGGELVTATQVQGMDALEVGDGGGDCPGETAG